MRKRVFDVLLILALSFVLLDLSSRLNKSFDLSSRKLHSLSPLSLQVLDKLEGNPLRARVLMEEDDYAREDAEQLLSRYKAAYGKLDFHFVSPIKNPGLLAEYEVGSHGVIVWEWKGKREKSSGISEESFTNALRRLVNPSRPIIYFVTGHGEKSLSRDYSALGRNLEEEGYIPLELLLQKEGGVPPEAACIVVAGPKMAYTAQEIEILESYLNQGGRLLILLDPYQDGGLKDFLKKFGIGLEDDAIVDPGGRLFGGDLLFPMAVEYPDHPVSRGIDGVCIFPLARSLSLLPTDKENIETRVIARTSPEAWGETDRASLAAERPVYDPLSDIPGPIALALSAEVLAEYPEKDGILLVVGDSDFVLNVYAPAAHNTSLFLNSIAWLIGPDELLEIRPVEPGHHPILLSRGQGIFIGWLVLGILPAVLVVLGVRAWLKRRFGP